MPQEKFNIKSFLKIELIYKACENTFKTLVKKRRNHIGKSITSINMFKLIEDNI